MEFNKIDNLLGQEHDSVPSSLLKNGLKCMINQIMMMVQINQ